MSGMFSLTPWVQDMMKKRTTVPRHGWRSLRHDFLLSANFTLLSTYTNLAMPQIGYQNVSVSDSI